MEQDVWNAAPSMFLATAHAKGADRSPSKSSAPLTQALLRAAGGDSPYCVLDKCVPGYYHRRTEAGDICGSCCCNNTASEHAMAERLIIDDLVHWARAYKASACWAFRPPWELTSCAARHQHISAS